MLCCLPGQSIGLRVNQAASEAKELINKTKSHYITEGRSLPQEIASQVRNPHTLVFLGRDLLHYGHNDGKYMYTYVYIDDVNSLMYHKCTKHHRSKEKFARSYVYYVFRQSNKNLSIMYSFSFYLIRRCNIRKISQSQTSFFALGVFGAYIYIH